MQASLSHSEFMAYAKSKGLALEKITETRVYLDLAPILGMPEISKPNPGKLVDLWLMDKGERFIGVIKVVRGLTGLGLAEAKLLGDTAPKPVFREIPYEQALKAKKELEEAGATVEIR